MTGTDNIQKITIVNPTKEHTATLFYFHGSGSNGTVEKEWVDSLNGEELQFPHIKIVYPTAAAQPYTPLNGTLSNVWFNRRSTNINAPDDAESINLMCQTISKLIDNEVSNGIPYNRIAIGGFSMGGALSFHVAYRYRTSLAGCYAMSSFLNTDSLVYQSLRSCSGRTPPLLQFQGTSDELVPKSWGEQTYNNLKALGVNGHFIQLNNMSHELTSPEIMMLKRWILEILPEK